MTSFVIIGIGIPGSGKARLLTKLSQAINGIYISADNIRQEITGSQRFSRQEDKLVWNILYDRVGTNLVSDRNIVIDAPNARLKPRRELVTFCRRFPLTVTSPVVCGYWFKTPLEVCLYRNKERQCQVKESVIRDLHFCLETKPPRVEEGFHWIEIVES